jgi:DNA polymerase-3 subunit gamma/tau
MPYLSLYRKYRPRTFGEIVGQRHVTQTLANAVKQGRIAHAYLFCGPRGTGKTSTARVLAMALNCEQGPTPEPCGVCESCLRIVAGSALDVIEIDAASNRGIDEIRQLRERVGLAPAESRMKVYIVDEVHMLTGEAFNAFLKTLEEPPAHVVFVLATTEPHRVLPTILSRCQRFDFHRIGLRDLEATVRSIAEKESIAIDERAVAMLAHAADGSVRDALTLLDQAVAYAEGTISPEVVSEILGGIDFDLIAEFTDVLAARDVAGGLALIDRVVAEGKDLRQLVAGLIDHYRDLLVLAVDPRRAGEALALPEEAAERTAAQARQLTAHEVVRTLDLLADADRELRFSSQPRLVVELAAVRVCGEPSPAREAEAVQEASPPVKAAPQARAARPREKAAAAQAEEVGEAGRAVGEVDLGEVKRRWDEVLAHLRREKQTAVAAFLREAVPTSLEDGVLTLSFNHEFHHDQIVKDPARLETTARAIASVLGIQVRVKCRLASQGEGGAPSQQPKVVQDALTIFPGSEVEQ